MDHSKAISAADSSDSKHRDEDVESLITTQHCEQGENITGAPLRTPSSMQTFTETNLDDLVPADSYTSCRLDELKKQRQKEWNKIQEKMQCESYFDEDSNFILNPAEKGLQDQAEKLKDVTDQLQALQVMDLQRRKNEKLTDLEKEEKIQTDVQLKKANEMRLEQEDEIKLINEAFRPGFPPHFPQNFMHPGMQRPFMGSDFRFRGMPPPHQVVPESMRPDMGDESGHDRPPVVKDRDLEQFNRLELSDGAWARPAIDVDYSERLVFSDDEDGTANTKSDRGKLLRSTSEGERERKRSSEADRDENRQRVIMSRDKDRDLTRKDSDSHYPEPLRERQEKQLQPGEMRGASSPGTMPPKEAWIPQPGAPYIRSPQPMDQRSWPQGGMAFDKHGAPVAFHHMAPFAQRPGFHPSKMVVGGQRGGGGGGMDADDDEMWRQRRKQQNDDMAAAIERARQRRQEEERRMKEEQLAAAKEKLRQLDEKLAKKEDKSKSETPSEPPADASEGSGVVAVASLENADRSRTASSDGKGASASSSSTSAGKGATRLPPRFQKSSSYHSGDEPGSLTEKDNDAPAGPELSASCSSLEQPQQTLRSSPLQGQGPPGGSTQVQKPNLPGSPHGASQQQQQQQQHPLHGVPRMPSMGYWPYDPRWAPMAHSFMMDPRMGPRPPFDPATESERAVTQQQLIPNLFGSSSERSAGHAPPPTSASGFAFGAKPDAEKAVSQSAAPFGSASGTSPLTGVGFTAGPPSNAIAMSVNFSAVVGSSQTNRSSVLGVLLRGQALDQPTVSAASAGTFAQKIAGQTGNTGDAKNEQLSSAASKLDEKASAAEVDANDAKRTESGLEKNLASESESNSSAANPERAVSMDQVVTTVATSAIGSGLFVQIKPNSVGGTSVFGQPQTTVLTSVFGQPQTTTSGGGIRLFGQGQATAVASGFRFGQPQSTSGSSELFGQETPAATSSFGQSSFGQGFGQAFGQQTASSTTPAAGFGQTTSGTGGLLFGQGASLSPPASGFGFGSPSAFGTSAASGQQGFGQTTSGSGGGSMFGGLDEQPDPKKAKQNVFGLSITFEKSQQNTELFVPKDVAAVGTKTSSVNINNSNGKRAFPADKEGDKEDEPEARSFLRRFMLSARRGLTSTITRLLQPLFPRQEELYTNTIGHAYDQIFWICHTCKTNNNVKVTFCSNCREKRSITAIQPPSYWDVDEGDPEAVKNVQLYKGNKMFDGTFKVLNGRLMTTLGGCPMPVMSEKGNKIRLVSMRRNQNLPQFQQYIDKRETIACRLRPGESAEVLLWHGCSSSAAKNIMRNGFDSNFIGKNVGAVLGNGFYFSSASSYSLDIDFATLDHLRHQSLLLCRVATGSFTKGSPGLPEPPFINGRNGLRYDSVVDSVDHPLVACVFCPSQVYPEHWVKVHVNE